MVQGLEVLHKRQAQREPLETEDSAGPPPFACLFFFLNPVPSPSISNPFVYLAPLSIYRDDPFLPACPPHRFQFLKICNSQSVSMPWEADKSTWHAENYTTVNNNRISFVLFWHFTIKWNANAWPRWAFLLMVLMVNKDRVILKHQWLVKWKEEAKQILEQCSYQTNNCKWYMINTSHIIYTSVCK